MREKVQSYRDREEAEAEEAEYLQDMSEDTKQKAQTAVDRIKSLFSSAKAP
jgi:hypothetical protein